MNAVRSIVVIIPCYNDWEALTLLLQELDEVFFANHASAAAVLIDDRSSARRPEILGKGPFKAFAKIDLVRLRQNMGHQRAICIGLSHVYETSTGDAVVIMDADGEDRPGDIPKMLAAFEQNDRSLIVFAERTRRSEGVVFRVGYFLYRALHLALTGIRVKVGNFSVMAWDHLGSMVVVSEMWNHYAASVFSSKIGHTSVPTTRGTRIAGQSKLNLVALIMHGLSAIAVFLDVVGVRLTLVMLGGVGLLFSLCLVVLGVKFGTNLAIPGWATMTLGLLLIILIEMFVLITGVTGLVLFGRNNMSFIPIRDYKYFIGSVSKLYPSDD